jgi:hypothetical protein
MCKQEKRYGSRAADISAILEEKLQTYLIYKTVSGAIFI